MLEQNPGVAEIKALLGKERFQIWERFCNAIEAEYPVTAQWTGGGAAWNFRREYYLKKNLFCALYIRKECMGAILVFNRADQDAFERRRRDFSKSFCRFYDEAGCFRDGKWLVFKVQTIRFLDNFLKLLDVKCRLAGHGKALSSKMAAE